jgi:hypothetical protein
MQASLHPLAHVPEIGGVRGPRMGTEGEPHVLDHRFESQPVVEATLVGGAVLRQQGKEIGDQAALEPSVDHLPRLVVLNVGVPSRTFEPGIADPLDGEIAQAWVFRPILSPDVANQDQREAATTTFPMS